MDTVIGDEHHDLFPSSCTHAYLQHPLFSLSLRSSLASGDEAKSTKAKEKENNQSKAKKKNHHCLIALLHYTLHYILLPHCIKACYRSFVGLTGAGSSRWSCLPVQATSYNRSLHCCITHLIAYCVGLHST